MPPIVDPSALVGTQTTDVPANSVRGVGVSPVLEDAAPPSSSQDAVASAPAQLKAENISEGESPDVNNAELKSLLQQLVQLTREILSRFGSPADMNNPFDFLP
ncbi:MAG TPA: hypothetical protein VKJ65_10160 [Phycisphaerae bacterium]|nr:hypothetical protein [Phycisphaerae bacterium]